MITTSRSNASSRTAYPVSSCVGGTGPRQIGHCSIVKIISFITPSSKSLENLSYSALNLSTHCTISFIQGSPTLTIFAITRFLIIENILCFARKRHTYGVISLSHYFIYYQLGSASGGDKVKLMKIRFFFNLNRFKLIQKREI
jgi:hypothetical protein